jgi:predicted acylesterase/phospholipase RssA
VRKQSINPNLFDIVVKFFKYSTDKSVIVHIVDCKGFLKLLPKAKSSE